MTVLRVGSVLLCAVLAVSRARRSPTEPDDVQEQINSARCTSRCLSLHMTQITAAFRHIQSDQVLVWCENHRRCAQCLQPCEELWETRTVLPPKACEKQTECMTSRDFLASLRLSRQGDCPPPQRATGFAAACVESCSSDQHCPSSRKCCYNGCGHTCQAPANLYKGVPLKPRREMSFTEDSEGHVKVGWVSKFNVSMEPVVYILESRWNIGIHPSEDHASPWSAVAMTLSEDVLLTDLRPQRWYQFRVAAVNSQGSRGFTTPSKHYISSKDPSPPEPPMNIRVSNQTLNLAGQQLVPQVTERSSESGTTVAVLLNWEPPAQNELWVRGLLPATSYSLSVQSVAYWGQKRLKSHRAQLVFTTIPNADGDFSNELPSSSSSLSPSSPSYPSVSHPESPLSPVPSGKLRLEAAAPHYHDNQLQVKVFWKWPHHFRQKHQDLYILRWHPHTCINNVTSKERTTTVQGTHHTIKGLHFACKYQVSVALKAVPGSEGVAWVMTPTCSSISGRGGKASACNSKERLPAGRKVVLRPEQLTAVFQQLNGTLLSTFRWRMSQHALDPGAVEGFQFTWTLQSELNSDVDGPENALISQTQTIASTQRSVTVGGLQAGSVYQLQLQVLTAGGRKGAAVSKTIQTPTINISLL